MANDDSAEPIRYGGTYNESKCRRLMQPIQDNAQTSQAAAAGAAPSRITDTHNPAEPLRQTERLAYSVQEAAHLLGVNYFSVYRLVQRGKLKVCRVLRGKLLVPRAELLKLLKTESE